MATSAKTVSVELTTDVATTNTNNTKLEEGKNDQSSYDETETTSLTNDSSPSLRTKSRRDELLENAESNVNLISRLFPREPKAIGTRRYVMVIIASLSLCALLTFLFVSYYVVSVEPVTRLSNTEIYQQRTCLVLDQDLHHDVTVGLGSTWRGQLRVQYNMTAGVQTPMVATVHELVTGQLGYQSTAIVFLRRPDHQVGESFKCLVDVANLPYFAAPVSPTQEVASSVIAAMTIIGLIDLCVTCKWEGEEGGRGGLAVCAVVCAVCTCGGQRSSMVLN